MINKIITYIKNKKNDYRKKNIEDKPKRRFKYLDTFYYFVYDLNDGPSAYIYHIITDIDTNKKYALNEKDFANAHLQINNGDNIGLLKGQGNRNNYKYVKLYDEGTFWIETKLDNFYNYEKDNITIGYDNEKSNITYGGSIYNRIEEKSLTFYNLNTNNDITFLDDVTFISGFAEFDNFD